MCRSGARVGRSVRVTGRVQGVFFRGWTVEQARALGVAGWVRNCADGSVEAHLAGEAQAVERLIGRMRNGPPGAEVASLSEAAVEAEPGAGFAVRR